MTSWCVKVRRYSGGESVIDSNLTKVEAKRIADNYNYEYQSDNYYVEEWDPSKIVGFTGHLDSVVELLESNEKGNSG